MNDITIDELLAALGGSPLPIPEDFRSTKEWAKLLKCGTDRVLAMLHQFDAAGRLECLRGKRPGLGGQMVVATLYRILPAPKGKKK